MFYLERFACNEIVLGEQRGVRQPSISQLALPPLKGLALYYMWDLPSCIDEGSFSLYTVRIVLPVYMWDRSSCKQWSVLPVYMGGYIPSVYMRDRFFPLTAVGSPLIGVGPASPCIREGSISLYKCGV